MAAPRAALSSTRFTPVQWTICAVAALGFAFDIYELLVLPLIVGPALTDFGIRAGTPQYADWVSLLFYVPAVAGGVFGDDEVAETEGAGGVEVPVGAEEVGFLIVGHGVLKRVFWGFSVW